VAWKIVVPTALPGILTGVMLAVARAAGETAPLLFTALYAGSMWPINGHAPFIHTWQPTASMAVFIYNSSGTAYDNLISLAWAASFVLVITVLVLNIGGQLLSSRSRPQR
jgi:phosphate transport system permease protein